MRNLERQDSIALLYMIKSNLINSKYPPHYNSDFEFYNLSHYFNCYAYAMQFRCLYVQKYWPGFLSSSIPNKYNEKSIVDSFLKDCIMLELDFDFDKMKKQLYNDAYRVGIMWGKYEEDFHFIRENIDGTWSHMLGLGGSVERIFNPFEIDDYYLLKTVKIKRKQC